jgi:FMN phosphatase YigB (HAD superfamily)
MMQRERKTIIFDLDGTLADCTHRVPLIPDWDAFFAACDKDEPIWSIIEVYNALLDHGAWDIQIWSGRRDSAREKTLHWIERYHIHSPDALKMRPAGDDRPDAELKSQWLDEAGFVPVLIFEDRASVVRMFRDRGIRVAQVAPGVF